MTLTTSPYVEEAAKRAGIVVPLRRHGAYDPLPDFLPTTKLKMRSELVREGAPTSHPLTPMATAEVPDRRGRRRREMVDYSPVGVWMIAGTLLAVIVVTFVLHGWLL